MLNKQIISMGFIVILLFTNGSAIQAAKISIDHAYLRKLSPIDNGTTHMFVKNEDEEPVVITKVILDDVPLPHWGLLEIELDEVILPEFQMLKEEQEDKRIIWYRVFPNPILPGKIGDVQIKLAYPSSKPITIGIETNNAQEFKQVIQPTNNPFHLSYMGFNEQLDKVYIYAENSGPEALNVTQIFLDIQDITPNSIKPWEYISQGEKKCIVISLDKPLKIGEYITIKLETRERLTAEVIVKVFSFFPVTSESLTSLTGLGLEPPSQYGMYHIMDCPSHSHGTFSQAASKSISTMGKNLSQPGYIHICKAHQDRALFVFGEIPDIVRSNPSAQLSLESQIKREHSVQTLSAKINMASSPRVWHAVIPIVKDVRIAEFAKRYPQPLEVRLMVYYAISRGAKGIFYRFDDSIRQNKAMIEQVSTINKELAAIKEFLLKGETVPVAVINNPKVEACAIQAGYEAVVLILINHDTVSKPWLGTGSFIYKPQKNIQVQIKQPEGLNITHVWNITNDSDKVNHTFEGRNILIEVPTVDIVNILVLSSEKGRGD